MRSPRICCCYSRRHGCWAATAALVLRLGLVFLAGIVFTDYGMSQIYFHVFQSRHNQLAPSFRRSSTVTLSSSTFTNTA